MAKLIATEMSLLGPALHCLSVKLLQKGINQIQNQKCDATLAEVTQIAVTDQISHQDF